MLQLFVAASIATASHSFGQLDRLLAPVQPQPIAEETTPAVPVAEASPEKAAPAEKEKLVFTGEDLLRELRAQITSHFSPNGELALELMYKWKTINLPAADAAVVVSDYPREGITSSFLVRCTIVSGGQTFGEWRIGLRARLMREIWVASARLERGQSLEPSMVTAQKVDVLLNRDALLGSDTNPSEYELAQTVSVGQPLTKRDVVEKPLVRKNQIVEVVANRRAIAISMKAQALENGAARAVIKMRNLDSHKEFNAQVVDENHVHVIF